MTGGQEQTASSATDALSLKDAGNLAFKNGDLNAAIECYNKSLELDPQHDLKATIYRNRAMIRWKLDDAEGCEADSTSALKFNGLDTKALYRRALARESLENFKGALSDAREVLRLMPNDKNIIEILQRLMRLSEEKKNAAMSLEARVNDMNKLVFGDGDLEQRVTAMNNLLVLARETESGAIRVWLNGHVLKALMDVINSSSSNEELVIAAARLIDELAKNSKRALAMIDSLTERTLCRLIDRHSFPQYLEASAGIIQRLFNALAKMDIRNEVKPDPEVAEANKMQIIRMILEMEDMLSDATISARARETIIDLFSRNLMHMDGGLPRGWSWRFVEDRGLLKLLHASIQIPEQYEYPVTAETPQHLAVCLTRLHEDMVFDTRRTIYKERVDAFLNQLMESVDKPEVKIQLASMLIVLLQGPVDIGLNIVTNDRITAMMLEMASSDNRLLQSTAAELIVHTVSKHERATAILKFGIPVLHKLYESTDDTVKVRALMGLCKCASAGGDDAAKQTMKEGSTLKLAQTCKSFLLDPTRYSINVRRFACEGLSYLTLDADVKEWIVKDSMLLQALVLLSENAGALCVYAMANIYVNLTNSYEKPKIDEELVKLAQFAKHHVPEVHPMDTDDCVERRVRILVGDGAVAACVAISKTESKNALDLIARALLAFSEFPDLRGRLISEGGAKLLLRLTKEATPEGKIKAAHAIAKIGTQVDPSIAFPGQRVYEVVRPLIELLHPDIDGKPNYDAMLTLTNLASTTDSVRRRMIKERIIPKAEDYWFMNDHPQLRAAAAELFLNLLYCEEYFKEIVKPGTDRLKLWVLYCAEEDERLAMASSAGVALLTEDEDACKRIIDEVKSWPEVFREVLMSENVEIQRRGLIAIANMVESCEKVACEIVGSELFNLLIAITKLKTAERQGAQKEAQRAIDAAIKFGIAQPTDRELYERKTGVSTIREE